MPIKKIKRKIKEKIKLRAGRKAGRKAAKSFKGANVGIGVSGERSKKKRKSPAIIKKIKNKNLEMKGARAGRKAAKATKGMVGFGSGEQSLKESKYKPSRAAKVGAKVGTKVRKGAVGVKKTKGGDYVKYEKGSKAAGSFRSAFKKGCASGAASFSWDGRKYSCKKK